MIDSVRSNEIANMYYNQVWSHCLFIVEDEFETDDIVQKAFLLFEQKRETLDDRYIKAWLYKVVDNLAKEYFRSRKIDLRSLCKSIILPQRISAAHLLQNF